jgi:hypothetical protein
MPPRYLRGPTFPDSENKVSVRIQKRGSTPGVVRFSLESEEYPIEKEIGPTLVLETDISVYDFTHEVKPRIRNEKMYLKYLPRIEKRILRNFLSKIQTFGECSIIHAFDNSTHVYVIFKPALHATNKNIFNVPLSEFNIAPELIRLPNRGIENEIKLKEYLISLSEEETGTVTELRKECEEYNRKYKIVKVVPQKINIPLQFVRSPFSILSYTWQKDIWRELTSPTSFPKSIKLIKKSEISEENTLTNYCREKFGALFIEISPEFPNAINLIASGIRKGCNPNVIIIKLTTSRSYYRIDGLLESLIFLINGNLTAFDAPSNLNPKDIKIIIFSDSELPEIMETRQNPKIEVLPDGKLGKYPATVLIKDELILGEIYPANQDKIIKWKDKSSREGKD